MMIMMMMMQDYCFIHASIDCAIFVRAKNKNNKQKRKCEKGQKGGSFCLSLQQQLLLLLLLRKKRKIRKKMQTFQNDRTYIY